MSTRKQLTLWEEYKLNKRDFLIHDVQQLQTNLRYRNIDVVDCLEMALAIDRLNTFEQVVKTVDFLFKGDKR